MPVCLYVFGDWCSGTSLRGDKGPLNCSRSGSTPRGPRQYRPCPRNSRCAPPGGALGTTPPDASANWEWHFASGYDNSVASVFEQHGGHRRRPVPGPHGPDPRRRWFARSPHARLGSCLILLDDSVSLLTLLAGSGQASTLRQTRSGRAAASSAHAARGVKFNKPVQISRGSVSEGSADIYPRDNRRSEQAAARKMARAAAKERVRLERCQQAVRTSAEGLNARLCASAEAKVDAIAVAAL